MADLVTTTPSGLYCAAGDFHIDPWGPVETALITHVHGDHLQYGSRRYICTEASLPLLHRRLGKAGSSSEAELVSAEQATHYTARSVAYGEPFDLGGVRVSFHPAGHVLGSAQVRLEGAGETWVVSGDYKRRADPTCEAFEPVPCNVFITEATFALPIYRWDETANIAADILAWWDENRTLGVPSVLFCYAMGKAQRILAELGGLTDRTVLTHGAVEGLTALYREAGVRMLPTQHVGEAKRGVSYAGELILAPPSAAGSTWMRRFGAKHRTGFASGWMRVRGTRRRKGYDRGFPLSDHADWPDLLRTIADTGARRVLVTHGYADELARYLREGGLAAEALQTEFAGEGDA